MTIAYNTDYQIDINVQTRYLEQNNDSYIFAYNITIANHSQHSVKLLSRYWLVTQGDQSTQEISGEGVVGKQPIIEPSASYEYTSGTIMSDLVGTMEGYYIMQGIENTLFKVAIPPFVLAVPGALH